MPIKELIFLLAAIIAIIGGIIDIVKKISKIPKKYWFIFAGIFSLIWLILFLVRPRINIISPKNNEVVRSLNNDSEHFEITIKGTVSGSFSREKTQIYILVAPRNAPQIHTQLQHTARPQNNWELNAYLGGIGQYTARNGEKFDIFAVITDEQLRDKYNNLTDFNKEKIIAQSEFVTVTTTYNKSY
ncbi:MAG: hypothetical protein ACFFDN_15575 [Candidatus Hodarchaeota archaeon]